MIDCVCVHHSVCRYMYSHVVCDVMKERTLYLLKPSSLIWHLMPYLFLFKLHLRKPSQNLIKYVILIMYIMSLDATYIMTLCSDPINTVFIGSEPYGTIIHRPAHVRLNGTYHIW